MTTINTVEKRIEELDKRFADSLSPDNCLTEEFKEALRISFTTHEQEVRESLVESVAKAIYDQMSYYEDGAKPAWVENGNSFKQDEARKLARYSLTNNH